MRALRVLWLIVAVGCELEGPEDKRRDGETFEQAEARHAAERAAAAKPADKADAAKPFDMTTLAPGKTVLEAKRVGDVVVVDYYGWLTCDGNYELRSSDQGRDALLVAIIDKNTSKTRASCAGAVELHARYMNVPPSQTIVRLEQGPGYGELTAPIQ